MDDLKRCPFCGSEPTLMVRKGKNGWRDRYYVLCDYSDGGCGASGGWYHYATEAIEAWNRRVNRARKGVAVKDDKESRANSG